MNRTLSTALATLALAACGGNAANHAAGSGAPAPAAARKLTLTYFTITG